jgi:hypothetical protein
MTPSWPRLLVEQFALLQSSVKIGSQVTLPGNLNCLLSFFGPGIAFFVKGGKLKSKPKIKNKTAPTVMSASIGR